MTKTIESKEENLDKPKKHQRHTKSIQRQVEEQEQTRKKFGTFIGVFTPTLLTILGVILFLREGWVVGNAGFLGALIIITIAFAITGCTGLSMSSFVTNTRVGSGGAFSIVSQALGLEIGGSIGIPLYLAQVFAVCMYIFGFRGGWLWIFPDHPAMIIDYSALALLFFITFISTSFAFRTQLLILVIIIASLISVCLAAAMGSMKEPLHLWGEFPGSKETLFTGISFWGVFAVFFPASTGIMAGANMSGELKDPRKSIPLGTLSAIGISFLVYIGTAYWLAKSATPEQLLNDYTVFIDQSFYSPITLAGLLAATLSSALASFVGAPRILEALGSHNILPLGQWFSKRTSRGEPLRSTCFTFLLASLVLLLRDLNIIAPLITMIFLITYNVINLVVLIESSLELVSFRPFFKINTMIPLLGFLGSLSVMFIISPIFGLIAVLFIGLTYAYLMKRKLKTPYSDVRSGLFEAVAEWSAKKVMLLHGHADRAWKPSILLPLQEVARLTGVFRLVYHLAYPVGSVKLLGIQPKDKIKEFEKELENSTAAYLKHNVFASFSVMEETSFSKGVIKGMQALRGSFFRPNLLFIELPKDASTHKSLQTIMDTALYSKMGVALIVYHPESALGREETVNVWIPKPKTWEIEMKQGQSDLALLLSYRMADSWNGVLNILMSISSSKEEIEAKKYLERLASLARLPVKNFFIYINKSLIASVEKAPTADLSIFPMIGDQKIQKFWDLRDASSSTCLFCADCGIENAFA
jgi:solute carrier family 12 (sodium/potassium/chloride transporter), member 2